MSINHHEVDHDLSTAVSLSFRLDQVLRPTTHRWILTYIATVIGLILRNHDDHRPHIFGDPQAFGFSLLCLSIAATQVLRERWLDERAFACDQSKYGIQAMESAAAGYILISATLLVTHCGLVPITLLSEMGLGAALACGFSLLGGLLALTSGLGFALQGLFIDQDRGCSLGVVGSIVAFVASIRFGVFGMI